MLFEINEFIFIKVASQFIVQYNFINDMIKKCENHKHGRLHVRDHKT